eukprot:TRINITY_DN9803_c0_g1_i2.p1 TRINITY_DN9803_c0_g1~~TRINITY_DN9803_c0_g1_i2.p1  ORF type:complete len:391 (-),score=44.94 TRINITY_DN9803_c0_g1_i2:29-1201(-)
MSVASKIKGCLYGQAVGDAIGLGTEFMNRAQVERIYGEKFRSKTFDFADFFKDRHRVRWLHGDWTDDTDQTLLLLRSMVRSNGEANPEDFALRLRDWMMRGFPELGDTGGLGIGMTVYNVMTHPDFLDNPHYAAADVWNESNRFLAANGAVMRTSVLGIFNYNNRQAVLEQTRSMARVTHADPRCWASCAAVSWAIARLLVTPLEELVQPGVYENFLEQSIEVGLAEMTEEKYAENDKLCPLRQSSNDSAAKRESYREEFRQAMRAHDFPSLALDEGEAIGYTFKCLGSGFSALTQLVTKLRSQDVVAPNPDEQKHQLQEFCVQAYEQIMLDLIYEAGDADTNAAVAGALLGAALGFEIVEKTRWFSGLQHRAFFDREIAKLFTCMQIDA